MAVGYYDQDFEPWVRGIRGIGTAIMQQPMLRAQAAQRQQADQLTQARIGTEGAQQQHYRAESGKTDAETAILVKKGQLVTALEQNAAQAQEDIAAGNTDTPAVRAFSGAASALTGANGDDIVKSAREGIGTILGRMGKVKEAASVENPNAVFNTTENNASREKIAAGTDATREKIARNRPQVVSRDAGLWNPETQSWDVEKPDRPAGNPNNLYSPADRALLTKAGEGLAEAHAAGDKEAILKWNKVIKTTSEKYAKPAGASGAAPPPRRLGDAAMAPQTQDPDDSSDGPDLPAEEVAAPAASAPPAQVAAKRPVNVQALIDEGNAAINAGADPEKVKARLKEDYGITVQ